MNNVDIKDKSKEILEKINEIKVCLDKLIGDKESLFQEKSYNTCQSCLEEIVEEIAPYAQDNMPELKNGMFGIAVEVQDNGAIEYNTLTPFVVVNNLFIYQSGEYDIVNSNLKYHRVIRLYDTSSFYLVRNYFYAEKYEGKLMHLIWRDLSVPAEICDFYDSEVK